MSYTQIYYHIILRTKGSEKSISQHNVAHLYRYIWGIIENRKGKLYRINGIEDHIHILASVHPTIPLANFIKDIKVASTLWMKSSPDFTLFKGWSVGYAAFTRSFRERKSVIEYIKNQQKHHQRETSREEIIRILKEEGLDFDERFLS
ncbi:MAG: transposase [Candidatus Symbiothrix sp.]|jgi:REP element-mobilizing transposase RayT|nr:transposase [Candidatus Symbiothrix sp.]